MNGTLMKHKPKDTDAVAWKKTWESSSYVLQPLADTLKEWIRERAKLRLGDYETPNHYAKLVHELAQKQILEDVLALLPESLDK